MTSNFLFRAYAEAIRPHWIFLLNTNLQSREWDWWVVGLHPDASKKRP